MVHGYIKSLCREHYYAGEDIDFACSNFWAMMYEEGDYTLPHIHFPANFSAVYYIDVEPDSFSDCIWEKCKRCNLKMVCY